MEDGGGTVAGGVGGALDAVTGPVCGGTCDGVVTDGGVEGGVTVAGDHTVEVVGGTATGGPDEITVIVDAPVDAVTGGTTVIVGGDATVVEGVVVEGVVVEGDVATEAVDALTDAPTVGVDEDADVVGVVTVAADATTVALGVAPG